MDKSLNKHGTFYICLTLTLITAAVFWRVLDCDFIHFDDPSYVTDNPYVKAGLSRGSISWAFTTPHGGTSYWHPLTWLSHMIDCQLYGLDAGGHHLTNLLLHIINTLLLFAVFKQMTGALWRSAIIAGLFALHPLHVESVAWISERKDVLSAMFWMLTILGYQYYVKRPGIGRYLPVLFLFALALMSKPMVVTLPFILLLLDYWPLERFQKGRWRRLILEKVPFFVLSAILSFITFAVQRSIGAVIEVATLSLTMRITNAFISYVKYITKMIWPGRLAVFYPHGVGGIAMWQWGGAALLLVVVLVLVIRLAPKHKYLLTGWFWYFVTMLPVIGLIQVGSQAMANRYTYIPLTGLFVIIIWGAAELSGKWKYRKIGLGISASAVLLALSVCSWFQVGYWQNSVMLFEHSLKVTGGNSIAHYILANSLQFEGRSDEAIENYYKALSFNPDHTNARCNLANTLKLQGRIDEAIGHYRRVLQAKTDDVAVHNNLANALQSQGKFDEAIEHYRQALRYEPNLMEAHINLGLVLKATGRPNEALKHFKDALRLDINHPVPLNNMAEILATHPNPEIRNAKHAIALAKRTAELTDYQNAFVLDTLAVSYAADGQFDRATEVIQTALELAAADENEELTKRFREKLQQYKQGKP